MEHAWWQTVVAFLAGLWAMWEVKFLTFHILVNVVVALAAAIHLGEFQLAKIGEFLYKKLLPYLLVWAVAKVAADATNLGALALAAWAILELNLVGDLADNLSKLGIPLPDWLTKLDCVVLVEQKGDEASGG